MPMNQMSEDAENDRFLDPSVVEDGQFENNPG